MLRLEVLYMNFWGQPIKTTHRRIATWVNWMMPSPSGLNPNCAITPSWISVHNGNTTCWYLGHKDIFVWTVTCHHQMSELQVTHIVLWFFRLYIAENNLHHGMFFLLFRINSILHWCSTLSCYSQPPVLLQGSSDDGEETQRQTEVLDGRMFVSFDVNLIDVFVCLRVCLCLALP